jgi:hypothetical protein
VEVLSDCYRCEDDRTREDVKASQIKKCIICGMPAVYELDGKPYCLQHYAQALAKARAKGGKK